MPKLTEDGAPGAPRYPTLGDRLGRCLLWVSDASLLSRVPSSPLSPVLSHAQLWDPTSFPF